MRKLKLSDVYRQSNGHSRAQTPHHVATVTDNEMLHSVDGKGTLVCVNVARENQVHPPQSTNMLTPWPSHQIADSAIEQFSRDACPAGAKALPPSASFG